MRYKGQFHEVELPISEAELSDEGIDHIVESFHQKHEELYAYRDVVETEMINLRLAAYGKVVKPAYQIQDSGARGFIADADLLNEDAAYLGPKFEQLFGTTETALLGTVLRPEEVSLEGPLSNRLTSN